MRRTLTLVTIAGTLSVGCQLQAPAGTRGTPAPHASNTAVVTSPVGSPPPARAQLLKQPAAGTVPFSGQVKLGATDALQYGKARLQGGGVLVDAGAAGLVNSAGAVVAAEGGNVVVPASVLGGQALITNDGASLIGNDGASIITHDGATIITHDGATIITHDGATAVAGAASSRHLLADATGPVPAAGMVVGVFDPHKGQLVPVGQDEGGQPVFAVYSDAQGRFTVHLPADVATNVRVVAIAPGASDARLRLHVLAAHDQPAQLDETASTTTAYMRYMLARKLYLLMRAPADQVAELLFPGGSDDPIEASMLASALPRLQAIRQVLVDATKGLPAGPRRFELALLLTDAVLADLHLDAIQVAFGPDGPPDEAGRAFVGQPAVAVLSQVLGQVEAAARARVGSANFRETFDAAPYVQLANRGLPPEARYALRTPADVADFVVREYLTSLDDGQLEAMDHMFADLGLPTAARDAARGASSSLYQQGLSRLLGTDGDQADVLKQLQAVAGPAAEALAKEPTPPAPTAWPDAPAVGQPPSHPSAWQVETVAGGPAGKVQPGTVDGPVAAARLGYPVGLTARMEGGQPVIYFSEKGGRTIRRLAGGQVSTVAGNTALGPVAADGGPAAASFKEPAGLLWGKDQAMYVCDVGASTLRKVTFKPDGSLDAVSTIAGGAPGFLDGAGAQARFNGPTDVVQDPASGDLFVADGLNHRIRRVSLTDGQYTVTTVAGLGQPGDLDTPHAADALLNQPTGLAFGADGSLNFLNFLQNDLHAIAAPVGPQAATRFLAGTIGRGAPLGGFWANAQLGSPRGLSWDARGWFIVTTFAYDHLVAVTPGGETWSIAGHDKASYAPGEPNFVDGPGDQARFWQPAGVVVTPDGAIWVADSANCAIRRITARP